MKTNSRALVTLISVFFFWGFVAAGNDILIPVFKAKLDLSQSQSMMIAWVFYIGYTAGSVIYLLISALLKKDVLHAIGYKKGISFGLVVSALGTLLFYPAAEYVSFGLTLAGLFIVALGFSLQQTAANTLAVIIGDPADGNKRLSLAGGVNNIGTTIAPLIINYAIFGSSSGVDAAAIEISSVKVPYLALGALFVIAAVVFYVSRIPEQRTGTEDPGTPASGKKAWNYTQLLLGMPAIFLYVGVEVSTAANLPEFMKHELGYGEGDVAPFVALFWGSLMIGRWTAAADAFSISSAAKKILGLVLPFAAFGLFIVANLIAGKDVSMFAWYPLVIVLLIIANFISKGNAARQLALYSVLGIAALLVGMFSPDPYISVFAFISVGLFCSTLWPCIFTLAIAGLGKAANQGSSFLVMMIMGGGWISLMQGVLASEDFLGIRYSYVMGVLCFAYLAFYAVSVKRILQKQGVKL